MTNYREEAEKITSNILCNVFGSYSNLPVIAKDLILEALTKAYEDGYNESKKYIETLQAHIDYLEEANRKMKK